SASGCSMFEYLAQAGCGQLDMGLRARSIDKVVKDDEVELRTRQLLGEVASIKHFAEKYGLTPTDSYVKYAELNRPVAVWVVSASAPLRFDSMTWTFPVVGKVPYLGWFNRTEANQFG